jgi:hypothetical protein
VIDLHALRTTLGTQLARAGVAPQIAQRIMRHSDYKTTLTHYTVLGLTDTSRAVEALPAIRAHDDGSERATGKTGRAERGDHDPQLYPSSWSADRSVRARISALSGARPGPMRWTQTPRKNGPSGPSDAKRVTGIEPATFSLGSCEPNGASAESSGTSSRSESDGSASDSAQPSDDQVAEWIRSCPVELSDDQRRVLEAFLASVSPRDAGR